MEHLPEVGGLAARNGSPRPTEANDSFWRQRPSTPGAASVYEAIAPARSTPSPTLSGTTLASEFDGPPILACRGCDACDVPIKGRLYDCDDPRTWQTQVREGGAQTRGSLSNFPIFNRYEGEPRATLHDLYDAELGQKDERYQSAIADVAFLGWPYNFNLDGMPKHDATMTVCEERLWLRRRIKELTRMLQFAASAATTEIVAHSRLQVVVSDYLIARNSVVPIDTCHAQFVHDVIGKTDVLKPAGRAEVLRDMRMLQRSLATSIPCLRDLLCDRHGNDT